jgi:RNA polymerase sigma-70 factor (ECF subfamily)
VSSESRQAYVNAIEKTHARGLRRFLAVRMRHATADVPDLVQEVFLRLLRIPDFETIRNPQAYLYTIASHVLHQYTLKQVATSETFESVDLVAELPAPPEDADPAAQVETEQRFEELGRALELNSPKAYATLLMHRRDGMPLKAIAVHLGVSHTMVKRYLARALSYCQQHLEEKE